jgi:hypothetical protein
VKRSRLTALQVVLQALPQLSRSEQEVVRATVSKLLGSRDKKAA